MVNPGVTPYGGSAVTYPRPFALNPTSTVGYTGSGWSYPQGRTTSQSYYTPGLPAQKAAPGEFAQSTQKPIAYTDQQIRSMFQQQMLADPTLVGQLGVDAQGRPQGTLPTQLAANWQGSVLTPAQQAIAQFGGFSDDPRVQGLLDQLKGVAGPTFATPYGTASLGQGLGSALTDPALLASAHDNPYSTLNQNAYIANRGLGHAVQGFGADRHSSAMQNLVNQTHHDLGAQNYAAAQQLLSQIGGNVTNFQNQLLNAAQTQAQYETNAANNITSLMQQGLITIPTSYTPNINPVTGGSAGGRGYISGQGTYGRKPLY